MKIERVWAMYWSATGTTEKVVREVAEALAGKLGLEVEAYDFTLPAARQGQPEFRDTDAVIFGTPTYAGRVPNVLLKYLDTLAGHGAAAVPVVTYGNRNFDDSLVELRDILANHGFRPLAAGAFVGEHSFSATLAAGRPDAEDLALARQLGERAAEKLAAAGPDCPEVEVEGTPKPYRGYYQPRDRAGAPVNILKVKPLTSEACDKCGLCVKVCPMGSISAEDPAQYVGICIKCGACVKKCPVGAKYYDDAGYLYHKTELEEGYARRGEDRVFL